MVKYRLIITVMIGMLITTTGLAGVMTVDDIVKGSQQPDSLVYKTVGNVNLKLIIFNPVGFKPTDHRTAVVFIHGGGWASGFPGLFYPHCRYFASRGAVAVSVNYRLAAKQGPTIFDCLADCRAAVRYIRNNGNRIGIDPDKIAVAGDSAGGHLAACLGAFMGLETPGEGDPALSMANAVVLYNPAVEMSVFRPDLLNTIFGITTLPGKEAGRGNTVVTQPEYGRTLEERIRRISPQYYVSSGQPPVLLMHGTSDKVIPIEQVYRYDEAMKKAGNKCELIALEGANHAFVLPGYGTEETIVRAIQAADRFLASLGYIDGEPTIALSGKK